MGRGAYRIKSACAASYFLTIDDFSWIVWTYLLYNKLEAEIMFLHFVALMDKQFNQTI